MSTNGVYGQMQSWLNGHGKNVSDFSSKMDEFEK